LPPNPLEWRISTHLCTRFFREANGLGDKWEWLRSEIWNPSGEKLVIPGIFGKNNTWKNITLEFEEIP